MSSSAASAASRGCHVACRLGVASGGSDAHDFARATLEVMLPVGEPRHPAGVLPVEVDAARCKQLARYGPPRRLGTLRRLAARQAEHHAQRDDKNAPSQRAGCVQCYATPMRPCAALGNNEQFLRYSCEIPTGHEESATFYRLDQGDTWISRSDTLTRQRTQFSQGSALYVHRNASRKRAGLFCADWFVIHCTAYGCFSAPVAAGAGVGVGRMLAVAGPRVVVRAGICQIGMRTLAATASFVTTVTSGRPLA